MLVYVGIKEYVYIFMLKCIHVCVCVIHTQRGGDRESMRQSDSVSVSMY